MIIQIKHKHIDKGIARDPDRCPVSLALEEVTKTKWNVSSTTWHNKNNYALSYRLSPDVSEFIHDFDNGRIVKEIQFELTEEMLISRRTK